MDKIIIFGAGQNGFRLKKELVKTGLCEVIFYCDNNERKWGNKLDNVKIISFEQLKSLYQNDFEGSILISTIEPDSIVDQIRESGLETKVYGVKKIFFSSKKMRIDSYKDLLYEIDIRKPRLNYFEYHITYHCNLRCKGCGHYSNIAPVEFGDIESYKRDLARLKELFWGVKRIRLMGGEPLLNKKLADFVFITRSFFPDSNIRVVTNGLLIPTLDDAIFETMNSCFTGFDITQYPPTKMIKEKIELRCIEKEVDYSISPLVEKFFDNKNVCGELNKNLSFERCVSKECHFLENGKMSVCGFPILYKKYKNLINIERDIADEDVINIYDKKLNGFILNELLSKPINYCQYCDNVNKKWFNWTGNYPHLK